MSQLKGACIFGQSGGPTAVINASASGVIQEALKSDCITGVYGAAHGIKGMLKGEIFDMAKEDQQTLDLMLTTPSSALGSVRYKLKSFEEDEQDYIKILDLFKKYNIRYFFYNGGNDSMDTCSKISRYMEKSGYECRVMGVPKTIDNDLWGTDHCPGYGSAAKYIATSFMEVNLDAKVYDTGMVTIIEVMGRNAGWLTAASALASTKGLGPDLVYLPEVPFTIEKFITDVTRIHKKSGKVIAAVSEGVRDKDGLYVAEMNHGNAKVDSFGHAQLGGVSYYLASIVKNTMDVKVRAIELSLLQRCAAHCSSRVDVEESFMAGQMAVRYAVEGKSGYMVGFEREAGPVYQCKTKLIEISSVANEEKLIPREWINEEGNGMNQPFMDYAAPLILGESNIFGEDGLPRFAALKKVPAI